MVSELLDDELLELLERALDCREPSLDFEATEVLELELLVELTDLLRDLEMIQVLQWIHTIGYICIYVMLVRTNRITHYKYSIASFHVTSGLTRQAKQCFQLTQ